MIKHFTSTWEIVEYMLSRYGKGRTLDVGAGNAKYRKTILPHVREYVTSDLYPSPEVDHIESATALHWKEGEFDTVMSLQTLEHVDRPAAMVAELYRVLRPGGTCLLTVPFIAPEHKVPTDFQRYTRDGLSLLFTNAGFEIIECEGYGGLFVIFAEWVKFLFVNPHGKGGYGRVRRKLAHLATQALYWMEKREFSKSQHFYANVYIAARKPAP